MIIRALASYGASVLIIAAAVACTIFFFKKTARRLSPLHMVIGSCSFFVVLALMFLVLMYAFGENQVSYMIVRMPEGVYKITVAVLFFTIIGLLRYFVVNGLYFNNQKDNKGMSFMAGYGIASGVAVALYCLFMLAYVGFTALGSSFVALGEDSTLEFANGTRISVFTPLSSHIFVAAIFAVYFVIVMIISIFMDQHSKLPYRKRSTFIMYLITNACEILMICIVLFASSKTGAVAIWICSLCILLLAGVSLRMIYRYKETLPYAKQFD